MAAENNTKRPLVTLLSTEFIERVIEEAKAAGKYGMDKPPL